MNSILIVLMSIAALFKSFTLHENYVKFKWTFYGQCLIVILHLIDLVCGVSFSVILPNSYSALDGDLLIQMLQNNATLLSSATYLNLFRLNGSEKQFLKRIKLAPDIQPLNTTHITFGCQHFLYGGQYQLQIIDEIIDNRTQELATYENFHVDWPKLEVNVSEIYIPTYPDEDVHVELRFPTGKCRKRKIASADKPEYWLEVLYCGLDTTQCNSNRTTFHVLYTEQVKYLQNKVLFNLSCDLFGMAGLYAINVKPMSGTEKTILAQTYIHADWNEKFVLNVIDRSIIPCDPYDGIGALFEYPKCIDFRIRDRIRVFGRIRPDIWALNPPTTLEYIADHRIQENQHAKYFDCDLFTEKYVEFCFTYVTQAIFGAVAEIRVDCVPTYPLTEMDHGGWSPWSDWTPCSTSCNGGQRHRYRFCNSPMPRYGGKYCEGPAIETIECGNENADKWECLFGVSPSQIVSAAGNKSVNLNDAAVSKCACGCVAEFSHTDEIRVFALSTINCLDNKLFWLIQANETQRIQLTMDFVSLPCPEQHIKIRDGDLKSSELLATYEAITVNRSNLITSSGRWLLLEYFTDPDAKQNSKCNGRFLAHSMQLAPLNETTLDVQIEMEELALIQIVSFTFAAFLVTTSSLLVIHYIIRYRKYEIAKNLELFTPAHTPTRSLANNDDAPPPSRAISTTTLISEVVYFVKMRHKNDVKHKRLRESTISERSHRLSDPNCSSGKQQQANSSLNSATSHSTQTIYKVISPVTVHADSSSIASFPCYKSKSAKMVEQSSKRSSRMNPSATCGTLKRCKENHGMEKSCSSKDVTENCSNMSSPVKNLEVDCVLSGGSSITLTSGCYSTPARAINTATIRATNQKECKDKQNLEKLLSRPQSEFSLGTNEDFEMDYYDYNVLNAADVPGSYLGMDPAYLVWIPPLEEESAFNATDATNGGILPRHDSIDTGSNKESPSPVGETALSPTPSLVAAQKRIENACHITKSLYQGVVIGEDDGSPKITLHSRASNVLNRLDNKLRTDDDDTENEEKETTVLKSPCKGLHSFYDAEDIQFVDD